MNRQVRKLVFLHVEYRNGYGFAGSERDKNNSLMQKWLNKV